MRAFFNTCSDFHMEKTDLLVKYFDERDVRKAFRTFAGPTTKEHIQRTY